MSLTYCYIYLMKLFDIIGLIARNKRHNYFLPGAAATATGTAAGKDLHDRSPDAS